MRSLELDFLAELVKQPNMEANMRTIAQALKWDEIPAGLGWEEETTYGSRLAELVTTRLVDCGIVKYDQARPGAHWRVPLERP